MNNMRRGFTMIELVFVIVIIGILAAVAIPKMSATRDDAKVSTIVANTRTVLADMKAYYLSQGSTAWGTETIDGITDVPLYTAATCTGTPAVATAINTAFHICESSGTAQIVRFDVNATAVTVTTTATGTVGAAVTTDSTIIALAGLVTVGKTHDVGGSKVIR